MRSTDTMLQPQQVTSPTSASRCSLDDQQDIDQFTQMRTMLSSFLRQKQETTTHTAFCNYLVLEVKGLEEREFQTFRNEAVNLLSNIQSKAEECGHQPQHPQQQTLSHSSSAAPTFVLNLCSTLFHSSRLSGQCRYLSWNSARMAWQT